MSPASGRGDRRLRCEGWASGSGEADAGKQVHLAKVPWRRRLRHGQEIVERQSVV